jgi:GDPmannose 4,6-dehydratase
MRRVVIVGSKGQDGSILFAKCSRDCAVIGLDAGTVTQHQADGLAPREPVDVLDREQVRALLQGATPDEVYYLAAHHHSSEESPDEAAEMRRCAEVHLIGLVHFLDALRVYAPRGRLFYAGSSQLFGQANGPRQDETTPFAPRNPYAITKAAGAQACALYRERYGVHASVGILYNHESPLRGPRFVTQRIAHGVWQAKRDPRYRLTVGSLSAVVDWGYAPDYVDAMTLIVAQPEPDDYVIATGQPHTVGDFIHVAFRLVGLDWRAHVVEDATRVRTTPATLVGDATKLRARTGWKPTVGFDQLVEILVRAAE